MLFPYTTSYLLKKMNLITAGLIQPQELLCDQLRQEIATILQISINDIEKIQLWPHQLWVNITGVGGRLISYRRLPSWLNLVINLINDATSLEELENIAKILGTETKKHPYEPQALEKLRHAYAKRRHHLKKLQPSILHHKLGELWLEHWQNILQYCKDYNSLGHLVAEMKVQSEQFADLPDVMANFARIWQDRTQELAATG